MQAFKLPFQMAEPLYKLRTSLTNSRFTRKTSETLGAGLVGESNDRGMGAFSSELRTDSDQ